MEDYSHLPGGTTALGSIRHYGLSPRSPAPKQRGGPNSSPYPPRSQRQQRQGNSSVLKLLVVFVVAAGLMQLFGMGATLRRAIFSRCSTFVHEAHDISNSRGGKGHTSPRASGQTLGLWEHLCAREATSTGIAAAAAAKFSQALSGDSSGADDGLLTGTGGASASSTNSGSDATSSRDSGVYTAESSMAFGAAAAVAAASSYHPAEWPQVYGGRAEPHMRILQRCSGSLFAPPLRPKSRPAHGLVGMWLPQPYDLAFCDNNGNSVVLQLRPASAAAAAPASPFNGSNTNIDGRSVSSSVSGHSTGDSSSWKDSWFWSRSLSYWNGRTAAGENAGLAIAVVSEQKKIIAEPAHIDLATSQALVVDGGSVRLAWVNTNILLADGVAAELELPTKEEGPCRDFAAHFTDYTAAFAAASVMCAVVGPSSTVLGVEAAKAKRGSSSSIRGRFVGSRSLLDSRGSSTAGGKDGRRGGTAAGGGKEVEKQEEERGDVGAAVAAAPTLVLATRDNRMVLRLVELGADVVAAARSAVALLNSADTFTRRLETAVVASYEALRTVPYDIGLPRDAPAEDIRLSRKLYDIMSLNTAPHWSTPDRTPHGYQWLWDSCFHALGMNLVNHTLAWDQLRGLLRCQQSDGFLPHICKHSGGRGSSEGGDDSSMDSSSGSDGGSGSEIKPGSRSQSASQLTQPPLLAWAVWDNYLFSWDKRRLEWALPRITSLLDWLARHRSRDSGLTYFYVHGFESGMDNSPRFDGLSVVGRLSAVARSWTGDPRVGSCALCAPHLLSVDLCALVAREMAIVSKMLQELGREEEADLWAKRSRSVAEALLTNAWNPERRMYGDVVNGGGVISGLLLPLLGAAPRGRVSDLVTVAGLLPLLAGKMPHEHLRGVLSHLKDPNSFATPVPLPSVAVSFLVTSARRRNASTSASTLASPSLDMWRGPMWVNINYLVAAGLREQGDCEECDRLAEWIVRSTIAEVRRWYDGGGDESEKDGIHGRDLQGVAAAASNARGTVFEFYDSTGKVPPTRLTRKGLQGAGGIRDYHWTAALTLRMMAEEAARAADAARNGHRRHGGNGSGGRGLPEWVPTG